MSDQSPKKLDKLFRQGSEQYDFDYNAEAWQQMETLLEKDDSRRRIFWWWFTGLAILLLPSAFWFFGYNYFATIPPEPNIQNTEQSLFQKETTENNSENIKKNNLFEIQKNTDSTQNSNKENAFSNTIKNKINHQTKSKKENKTDTPPPLASTIFEKAKSEKQILADDESSSKVMIQDSSIQQNQIDKAKKPYAENILLKPIPTLPLAMLDNDFESRLSFNLPLKNSAEEELSNIEKQEKPTLSDKNAFIFGLLVATEMTSVGMDNFSKFSWKLGGQLEYRFMKKYSVGLGANFYKITYEAGEGEYVPPKGFWTRTIAPQSTFGVCKVIEVPLAFGYYPKGFSKNGFYFNAGIKSYFLLWEWYDYFYDLPDPDLIRGWGTTKDSQYWFGIGQFSIGYNYMIGRKTSLQIEPYLQIPFTGIGHGNVKLWSLGVSLKANLKIN